MPRIARTDVGGEIYHILNRANALVQIFDNDNDFVYAKVKDVPYLNSNKKMLLNKFWSNQPAFLTSGERISSSRFEMITQRIQHEF